MGEEGGLFDGLLEGGFTLLLGLLEHLHVLLDAALDAAFVEGKEIQVLGVGGPRDGLGEGGLHLGMLAGVFVGFGDSDGAGVDIE